MKEVSIIGVDLAKQVFQLHGATGEGELVFRKKLSRRKFLAFMQTHRRCTVAMEACATAHYWARTLTDFGHDVRLIAPKFVKPYVKSQKNDMADAEAIAEAASRPTMRFVEVKTPEQQGLGMIFRLRDLLVGQRTQTVNALRGHLAEFGVVTAKGRENVDKLRSALAFWGIPASSKWLKSHTSRRTTFQGADQFGLEPCFWPGTDLYIFPDWGKIMPAELTINEAAHLAGVSTKLIEKSVESGILRAEKVTDVLTRRLTRRLPLAAVPFLSAINDEWLRDLPVARKRRIWTIVSRSGLAAEARLAEIRLNETITLDLESMAGTRTRLAYAYRAARDAHLVSDDEILGGTPVIRGTRLTVYSVLGRLEEGDAVADLVEDYPGVPEAAFLAAATYAKTHPLRGRPSGRPWVPDAAVRH